MHRNLSYLYKKMKKSLSYYFLTCSTYSITKCILKLPQNNFKISKFFGAARCLIEVNSFLTKCLFNTHKLYKKICFLNNSTL